MKEAIVKINPHVSIQVTLGEVDGVSVLDFYWEYESDGQVYGGGEGIPSMNTSEYLKFHEAMTELLAS